MNHKTPDIDKKGHVITRKKNGAKYCTVCDTERAMQYHWAHREELLPKQRERNYQRLYGITIAELDAMMEKQNYKCLICGKHDKLHVDHDHKSGKIRALLCNNCNRALGLFGENSERLLKASNYIEGVIDL